MADFIRSVSDFFDIILEMITTTVEGIVTLVSALGNIYIGISSSSFIFPSYLFGILLVCAASLVLLRVLGR